jgi:hypothetical protein
VHMFYETQQLHQKNSYMDEHGVCKRKYKFSCLVNWLNSTSQQL